MDRLDALWRRDFAVFALREIAKEMAPAKAQSPLDALIDACVVPTPAHAKRIARLEKAVERELAIIVECQHVLGDDPSHAEAALKEFRARDRSDTPQRAKRVRSKA